MGKLFKRGTFWSLYTGIRYRKNIISGSTIPNDTEGDSTVPRGTATGEFSPLKNGSQQTGSEAPLPSCELLGGHRVHSVFPYGGSSSAQLSLTSFETILLDCIVTAVISVCIF